MAARWDRLDELALDEKEYEEQSYADSLDNWQYYGR